MNNSLQGLQDSISQYSPGALYSAEDRMAYQLDDNLNHAREELVEMIGEILMKKGDLSATEKDFM